MKIGMLVIDEWKTGFSERSMRGTGIIIGFDKAGDPIVWFNRPDPHSKKCMQACYPSEIKIISN